MASIIQLVGEGADFQISEIKPHPDHDGLGFLVGLSPKTLPFQNRVFWYQGNAPPLEKLGKSTQKTLFLITHEHLKKPGSWKIGHVLIRWSGNMVKFY